MTGGEILATFRRELVQGADRRSVMLMIAGPNGAGKTMLWHQVLKPTLGPNLIEDYINADDIQRELNPQGPGAPQTEETTRQAQQEAQRQRELRIALPKDHHSHFAYETVFSDPYGFKLDELQRAKDCGYHVVMVFVGLDDVTLAQARVRNRVNNGGHDVPVARQVDRFDRVYMNARRALAIVPLALFLDNSRDISAGRGTHRPIAVCREGEWVGVHEDLPTWWGRIVD